VARRAVSGRWPLMLLVKLVLVPIWLALTCAVATARTSDDRQVLKHEGLERSYVVRVPANLKPGQPVPLVLVLHGGGGDALNAEAMTGFTEKAQREGFIVAYPDGSGVFRRRLLTWNAGHCCGHAMKNKADDVGFISALITRLEADYPVDPKRVYVTGMSNGGMMAHRIGIELSHQVAAIAPVVATVFGDERMPALPVAALMINGQLDASVPPGGGAPGGRFPSAWEGTTTLPALAQGRFWAAAIGCEAEPVPTSSAAAERWDYRCPQGQAVAVVLVRNNGHAWPGGKAGSSRGNKPTQDLRATDEIWHFFLAHKRED
jgi:polyhydroxybutyrate depolymerase